MSRLTLKSEADLVRSIRDSDHYKTIKEREFPHKARREAEAWEKLRSNRGNYTADEFRAILDKADIQPRGARWFGLMLSTPNQNLIAQASSQQLNPWLERLLFSDQPLETRINHCLRDSKIRGASKGLTTLLLYLSDPARFNVWVNATEEGLLVLRRLNEFAGKDWGANYAQFNRAAIEFRDAHKLDPREVDWFLSFIRTYVERDGDGFSLDEDGLATAESAIIVDDDDDAIDDVVGVPMELRVMRWTPVNEMGVVALFIEFRKELGFPVVELIRSQFPDAAVFEEASEGRYVRRYVEFEYRSSRYKPHLKSKRKCHYVVCWEDDWKACPVPVIELKSRVPAIIRKAGAEGRMLP